MKISSDSDYLYIQNIKENHIYLVYENSKLALNRSEDTFSLSITELYNFFSTEKSPLHFVNDNGDFIKINPSISEVTFEEKTFMSNEFGNYYIYIDKSDYLSIVYNKKPSLFNTYTNDSQLIDVDESSNSLSFQFGCKYFIPTEVKLHIVSRNTNAQEIINAASIKVNKIDKHIYQIQACIKLNDNTLLSSLLNHEFTENYNLESYDLYFSYKVKEMPLSSYPPRIKLTNQSLLNSNDEIWFDYNNTGKCLIKLYSTQKGNLSCRIFRIPKLTYEYYKSLKLNTLNLNSNKKPIILCTEYPEKAQDNAYIIFKYLISKFSDSFETYYILSNNSHDISNLKGYEDHVVEYQSLNHMKLLINADIILHTHSPNYSLPFLTNYLEKLLINKHKVFLQHGVIYSKDVSEVYGKQINNEFTDLFVVSSLREKNEVVKNYNYSESEVIVTGLPRFDNLLKNKISTETKNQNILIMPTWRKDQDLLSNNKFKETNFFKTYNSLLNDKIYKKFCEYNNITVNFYLHKNFQKFSKLFNSEFVNILTEKDSTVDTLLNESKLLITDYSSVGLDFSLMHKKVIYFRPSEIIDNDLSESDSSLLPGKIVHNIDELIIELDSLEFDPVYKNVLNDIYEFNDTSACYRIIREMVNKFNL
ncbi:CDP-glycerol glycerophosphotransferase family protein [Mammaliicoccus sciuri]|uniref:CDP-glycerol glycerophosphotransferase family protein n=1 Tax=Mammaliicoccus sciuri TaxID=1296 RepID=UPI002DB794C8|nr:CDP-glycerol glycerophosphotransferase family protein [Mammaliicoccus sciuri]MEB6257697.1 CDP-glycerol glycerophosphotransferase family protein [Mammaliicoccus sciuri]MEB6292872.1 CDP-glycerol glycerophosphotransferase family protein [Mammaliicoccus sciuri]MEB7396315.1 CDP-glycerol glycerophosphotransferase family protein [Mammaliicoccus sciuri]MEB8189300.1 CDP-glycerol glycerophosphotransferase family protein [Mammaliicoccus sciuri]